MPAKPKVVTIWEKAKLGATMPKPSIPVRPTEREEYELTSNYLKIKSTHTHTQTCETVNAFKFCT